MTGADPLPPAVLKRKAVVYVRQSTPAQVETVPVHNSETPLCAYAAMGSWPI
jgi:uncharacterized membrane protein